MSLCSSVYIDKSAFKALTRAQKAALLPVGVVDVKGTFSRDEAVTITVVHRDENRVIMGTTDVGLALVNYSSAEIARIRGQSSWDIEKILGYADGEYVAHRDNMVFYPKVTAALTKDS